jgi:hypothetical protein
MPRPSAEEAGKFSLGGEYIDLALLRGPVSFVVKEVDLDSPANRELPTTSFLTPRTEQTPCPSVSSVVNDVDFDLLPTASCQLRASTTLREPNRLLT